MQLENKLLPRETLKKAWRQEIWREYNYNSNLLHYNYYCMVTVTLIYVTLF